ncbi:uncharacterized protein LAESUDRAFT_758014 [Laetiporus sulphureus 93-53]|uniref:Uncharacterized protein n=1 Tax=Laetiporus sulphureus 93-53 TaxID=1314785 RepID=A0A165EVV0_9APHY|nr:uncharacterized protein LAESUDRAFT_758014 [Laetiporus sulphureus 93-53]KZT07872.1 hypothetical protein LAESUDRAFT_758014 [Laetiporus sulphureus 93-53]
MYVGNFRHRSKSSTGASPLNLTGWSAKSKLDPLPLPRRPTGKQLKILKMRWRADPSPQDDPLAFYATLREQGLSLFKDTNLEYATPILVAVAEKKKDKIARLLVQDILSNWHHVGQTYCSIMLKNILLLMQQNFLDKEQVAALARRSPFFQPAHINDTLATLLIGVLADARAQSESDEVRHRPHKAAELLMFIACDLTAAGTRLRSMEIVNALVQTHSVPSSVVYHANLMLTDFSLIIMTMSVHSVLHLGWWSTAGGLSASSRMSPLLVWLMTHLTKKIKKAHLARQLATHVLEAQIPLPVLDHEHFIGLVTSRSSQRTHACFRSGAMLYVVSLFTRFAK